MTHRSLWSSRGCCARELRGGHSRQREIRFAQAQRTDCSADNATISSRAQASHGADQRPAKTGRHRRSASGYATP